MLYLLSLAAAFVEEISRQIFQGRSKHRGQRYFESGGRAARRQTGRGHHQLSAAQQEPARDAHVRRRTGSGDVSQTPSGVYEPDSAQGSGNRNRPYLSSARGEHAHQQAAEAGRGGSATSNRSPTDGSDCRISRSRNRNWISGPLGGSARVGSGQGGDPSPGGP